MSHLQTEKCPFWPYNTILISVLIDIYNCQLFSLPEVTGEADKVEVLLNVVHDFGLEESLKEEKNLLSRPRKKK